MRKFMMFGLFAAFIGFAFADDIADRQTVTSLTYVNDELSEKQDIFGAQSGTQVATFTNTAGGIAPREVKSDLGNNTNDTALPTVSAVNDGLNATQDTLGANKHADYVATYTSALGELGEKGIYQDSGTYATQQNNLVDAGTFNAALQNGLDNEFICASNDSATGNCWLWTISVANQLPPEYTQLEYIETDGNVILDTQHNIDQDDVFELHYKMLPANISKAGDKMLLYGSNTWAETYSTTNSWYARFLSSSSLTTQSDATQYEGVLILKKQALIVNGVKILSPVLNTSPGSTKLCLFGRCAVTGTSIVQSSGFKITRNNAVIMNLVPARRNSDREIGMYDTVSNQFFNKTGTGTFIAGPEVGNNVYLPQNQ
ncbi:MAG: hypothetical protein J6Y07_03460 [Alphaproteobacteria bacterium]|nr:hypothetical protein [Alphaproteobacteria bacterium]